MNTASLSSSKPKDHFLLALGYALFNAVMLSGMSLFAKLLAGYFGGIEVTFFRNCFSFLALVAWVVFTRAWEVPKTSRPWAHLLRASIGTIGIVLGNFALSMMPLTETTILLFTAPLFVVLLSYPVLREPVGIFRLGAVLIGFVGVVIVARSANSADTVHSIPPLGLLLGLGWGFFAGCVDICLRWMGRTEKSTTTTFYFLLFGTLTTALHWPFAHIKQSPLNFEALAIIIGLGLTGLLAQLSKSQSLRLGEAAIISPVMYTMIIWTALFDYFIWDHAPRPGTILGGGLIIGANIFILYREHVKAKLHTPGKRDKMDA